MYNVIGMSSKRSVAKKIAVLALLTGLSLIMFIVENLLPPLFIPGAKLGFANIFSFAALLIYSPLEAFIVLAARTVLGAVFAGNFSALLYSFTGGVISMAVSSVLIYTAYPKISVMAVSIAAAVMHNITQNIVFVFLSGSLLMFGYMPYLALLGIFSGAVVGGIILLIFRGVPQSVFEKVAPNFKAVQNEAATQNK